MKREAYCMPTWVHKDTVIVLGSLPNPYGTFEKAKYRVYGYSKVIFYSCVTTCRSEEDILDMLMDWTKRNFQKKEYKFARIVKIQNGEEKVLFKGNVYGNNSKAV